jgi:hypothetical protein
MATSCNGAAQPAQENLVPSNVANFCKDSRSIG